MGNEEKARKLTRDEKFAVQQMGRFWKDWMYLKESDVPDYFIVVNKYHSTQTKRVSGIGTLFYENEDRDTNTVIGEIHGSM